MSTSEIGKTGEDIASEYLRSKGYLIIDRNFRQKWGEIDIITKSPDKILVFIEVKTIRYNSDNFDDALGIFIKPEDNLTTSKLKRLQRMAMLYANSNQDIYDEKRGWRIDLISVRMFAGKHRIDHFENI